MQIGQRHHSAVISRQAIRTEEGLSVGRAQSEIKVGGRIVGRRALDAGRIWRKGKKRGEWVGGMCSRPQSPSAQTTVGGSFVALAERLA